MKATNRTKNNVLPEASRSGKVDKYKELEIQTFLQNVQRVLQPIKIINPFAESHIKQSVFKPRRTNNHYLQFIEAITFYYQYQRKGNKQIRTQAKSISKPLEDIENANTLLKDILLRKSDEPTGSCRNYLEKPKGVFKIQKEETLTALEIRKQLRLPKTTQWRYHKQLLDSYLIKKVADKKAKTNHLEITNEKEYAALEAQIQTVLDDCLKRIKLSVGGDSPRSIVPKRSKTKVERLNKTKTSS